MKKLSKQPSWEQVAHTLASRVFLGYCSHSETQDDCPGCFDREAVDLYRAKCAATGRRYSGEGWDEELASANVIEVCDLQRSLEELEAQKPWPERDHSDPYCADHCSPGIKHGQCGCECVHAPAQIEGGW